MTTVFLPRYRKARKLLPSPRWSPSHEIPRKGQHSGRVTSWIAPSLPPRVSGSPVCLPASLSWTALHYLYYQASSRTATGLVPSGTWWRPHHKHGWCDLARLQAPPMYNNGARKHRVVRGMQTSQNTRLTPRATHKRWSNQPKHRKKPTLIT